MLLLFLPTCRVEKDPPSTLMWALFLLAQVVYCQLDVQCLCVFLYPCLVSWVPSLTDLFLIQHYDRRGQYDVALSKIDEAIEHTPTVIDLYSVKVCIYLHSPSSNFSVAIL